MKYTNLIISAAMVFSVSYSAAVIAYNPDEFIELSYTQDTRSGYLRASVEFEAPL